MSGPALRIRGLTYRYPDGNAALRGIDLAVAEGEHLGVIGPNGAGKSTLFFHLNGTFRGEGTIEVMGRELTDATLYDVRRDVGLVFQDPNDQLFMPTVFEDVAFGPTNLGRSEAEIKDLVQQALRAVGMEGTEALAPHHLSLGQRKKVALAAVLAVDPKILAYDEPSSGLDPRGRRSIMELLKSRSNTQLIATHDLDLVLEVCQRAVIIDGGRIVGEGKIPDLFREKELLRVHGLDQPLSWQGRAS